MQSLLLMYMPGCHEMGDLEHAGQGVCMPLMDKGERGQWPEILKEIGNL